MLSASLNKNTSFLPSITNSTNIFHESFTDSCEQFTDGYVLLRAVYDTYGLLQVIYGKNLSVDNRQKIFDMSKKLHLLSRILNSFFELLQVVTSY